MNMNASIADDRAYASLLARRYFYDRSVTSDLVLDTFGGTTDPLIAEMVDLIVHEPSRTGMLGARNDQYLKHYWPRVANLLRELERGESGTLPARGRFSLGRIAVVTIIAILCAASVIEHLTKIARHVSGATRLTTWELTLHTVSALFMSMITAVAIAGLVRSVRLYRAERERRRC